MRPLPANIPGNFSDPIHRKKISENQVTRFPSA